MAGWEAGRFTKRGKGAMLKKLMVLSRRSGELSNCSEVQPILEKGSK